VSYSDGAKRIGAGDHPAFASIKAIHFWNSQSILESVKWRAVSDYPERSTSAEHCWRSLLAARQNNYQIIVTKPIIHEMN
jgi:hypothetical protein